MLMCLRTLSECVLTFRAACRAVHLHLACLSAVGRPRVGLQGRAAVRIRGLVLEFAE